MFDVPEIPINYILSKFNNNKIIIILAESSCVFCLKDEHIIQITANST